MRPASTWVATLLAVTSTAGCTDLAGRRNPDLTAAYAGTSPPSAPNTSAATWQMPWQVSPSNPASAARGEEVNLVWVPETGYVRGTSAALASLGQPLEPAPGPNLTVEPCREVVRSEAEKVGARDVEAVSAGPQRTGPGGVRFAPVKVRVTYVGVGAYEVREALMTCIIDRNGKIVDAYS